MANKVLGIQRSDFEKGGNTFKGYSIFYSYERDKVDGLACGRQWVKQAVYEDSPCSPGDTVDFTYNKYGKVAGIVIL